MTTAHFVNAAIGLSLVAVGLLVGSHSLVGGTLVGTGLGVALGAGLMVARRRA